jgi:hypothetical protein
MRPWFHALLDGMTIGRLETNMMVSPNHPYLPQHRHHAGSRHQAISVLRGKVSFEPKMPDAENAMNVCFRYRAEVHNKIEAAKQ